MHAPAHIAPRAAWMRLLVCAGLLTGIAASPVSEAQPASGGPRGGTPVEIATPALDGWISPSEAVTRLEAAGYRNVGDIELHPKHYELLARNPWNESVEVHIDYRGRIYKERWLWRDARRDQPR